MSKLRQLPVAHDEQVASQVEPIKQALCSCVSVLVLQVWAGCKFKAWYKDPPANNGRVYLPGVPADWDDTRQDVVLMAVLQKALIAVENPVAA